MILKKLHFLLMALLGLYGVFQIYLTTPSNITENWHEIEGVILSITLKESMGKYAHGVQKKNLEAQGKFEYIVGNEKITSAYYLFDDYQKALDEIAFRKIDSVGSLVTVYVNPDNTHDATLFSEGTRESGNFILYALCSIFMIGGFYRFFEKKKTKKKADK